MAVKVSKRILARSMALFIVLAMLISLLPTVIASAYTVGSSFKIYSNPIYAGNSAYGKSYIWASAPDARITSNAGDTSVCASNFIAGDGVIHEPTLGSLDGFNTRVIVSHKAGYWVVQNNGGGFNVMLSRDSDLAAEVTYVENGVVKKSPAFRFTGFHYNAKQGSDCGAPGTVTNFDLGTYPNVVNVNVYHILSTPGDTTNQMQHSTPNHEYVEFDVAGTAGAAELPPDGKYYIEKTVLPNADKGVPMATPVPAAQIPSTPGPDPEPLVTPAPINTTSAIVPYGLGTIFTLFPEDKADLGLGDLNTNAAPFLNGDYGTVRYEIPQGGKVTYFSAYGVLNSSTQGAAGIKAIFEPKPGRLKGVVTEVKAYQSFFGGGPVPKAIVRYDGGKETTVSYMPDSMDMTYFYTKMLTIGSFPNLESVTIITTGTQEREIPSLEFKVVNDNPNLPSPVLTEKKYTKPNIPTATPDPSSPVPVPNVSSPLSINEAVAGNKTGITAKDGKRYDWIEIYNNSSSSVDVTGYGLTDSPSQPKKWVFPSGSVVPANGYLLVMASGMNVVIDGEIHTNFSISNETLMLTNPDGGIVSVLDLPKLEDDQAFARYPDGSGTIKLTVPTPGTSNNNAQIISKYVANPDFSAKSGFYQNPFNLTITSQGGTIHYTLDGSTPTAASPAYSAALPIVNCTQNANILSAITYNSCKFVPSVKVDKSMVVRAVVIDDEGNSSGVVTKSYFVGYDMAKDFNNSMVISMTTNADNLYDPNYGIFPNVEEQRSEFERQVHLDIFDKDGKLVINQDAGVRTRGFGYKYKEQKGINFYARSEYGKSKFSYPLFENSRSYVDGSLVTEYKSVALRNGSSNYNLFRFKDGEAQALSGETGTAFEAQRPVVLFINGEYWGAYYMAERADDDYVQNHYGIPKENVIVIKNHMNTGDATADDLNLYNNEKHFLAETDFTIPANYEKLTAKYDIQNLMLFYAANINLLSGDWIGYNFCTWRSRYITDQPFEDGKWHFMMYDVDSAYNGSYNMSDYFNGVERGWGVALLKNPSLKKIFCNIMCDTYINTYSPENVNEDMEYWYSEYNPLLPKMATRWNLSGSQNGELTAEYQILMYQRMNHFADIKRQFGLTGNLAYLNVRVNDTSGGNVKVNYIDHDFSKGSFSTWNFTDYTSTLQAIPKPGYRFTGWAASDGTTLSSDTDETTYVTLALGGSSVTANFERISTETRDISTAADLAAAAQNVNSGTDGADILYVLKNNIVLSGTNNLIPIGTATNPFLGVFDGNGFTIDGINISSTIQGSGLFGYVGQSGIVKNVGVTNVNIVSTGTEGKNIGGIAGNNEGLIEYCYSTGSLTGASTVGGIAGNNSGGKVDSCYSLATESSVSTTTLGGIAGKTENSGTIINCYSLTTPVGKTDSTTGGTVDLVTSQKTTAQFASNEVAYLLNNNGKNPVWGNAQTAPIITTDTNKPITIKVTFYTTSTTKVYAYTFNGGTVALPDASNWFYNGAPFTSSTVVTKDIDVLKEGVVLPTPTPTTPPGTTPTPTPTVTPTPSSSPGVTPSPSPSSTPVANLALNKPVTVSSSEGALAANLAVDGISTTRWGSYYTDPQWIYVDLGSSQNINRVVLNWENAFGKSYAIQTSNDAENWTDVFTTTTGDGGIDDISFNEVSARYVRMYGTARATGYGYSLWEFEVYGSGPSGITSINVASNKVTDVTISSSTKVCGSLIVATYDNNDILTGIKLVSVSDSNYVNGTADMTVNLDIPTGSVKVKAMLLDSLSLIKPLLLSLSKDL